VGKPKPGLWVGRSGAEVNGVEIGDSPAFLTLNGAGVLRRLLIAVLDFGMGGFFDAGDLSAGTLTRPSLIAVVNFGMSGFLDAGGSSAGTLPRRSTRAVLDFGMSGGLYPNLLTVLVVVLVVGTDDSLDTGLLLVGREGIFLSLGCRGFSSMPR
jgi:hypothetical protein